MKRIVLLFAICAVTIVGNGSPNRAIADDLDSRLAQLKKKNLDLKKMLRIEALEKENLALSQKLNVTTAHDTTRSVAVPPAKASREPAVYNAMAADYPTKSGPRYAPPEIQAPLWAGAYLGLHAAIGFGKWPTSSGSDAVGSINFSGHFNPVGGLAGLQAGYMWQIGSFVFGPEFDVSASTVGSKKTLSTLGSFIVAGSSGTFTSADAATLNWLSTLKGRVGVAAGDWLFFGTGGLAAAGLELASRWYDTAGSEVAIGYAVGGGLQYAFGPNARLRMEYLYYGFTEKTVSQTSFFSSPLATSTFTSWMSARPSMNVVRAGIDWRFN